MLMITGIVIKKDSVGKVEFDTEIGREKILPATKGEILYNLDTILININTHNFGLDLMTPSVQNLVNIRSLVSRIGEN
jgi:hypothetical protein